MAFEFSDRVDAGRQFALVQAALELDQPLIFALPRSGVPVAVEIAKALDLLLVRKIGAPRNPEGQSPECLRLVNQQRLQRYIGVIYRPETERARHFSYATLAGQYDAFVWFDQTRALTPLPTLTNTTEDETYPFGL